MLGPSRTLPPRLAAAARVLRLLAGWPLLLAIAGGSGAFAATHPGVLARLATNDVSRADRLVAVGFALAAFLVFSAIYLYAARRLRDPGGAWPEPAAFRPLRRWLGFVLAIPIVAVLFTPEIETDSPITTSLLILCAALLSVPTLEKIFDRGARGGPPRENPVLRHLPLAIVLALAAAYAVAMSVFAINNYHALKTRTWDLAIYANVMYQTSHGNPMGCSIMQGGYHNSAHFDPILVLIAAFYRLFPRTEYLLVVQSAWCGLGALPAFLLGRRHLRSAWAGVAFAAAWVLNPALQGATLLDFHSLTLVATPLLFALYFLAAGRHRAFLATLPVLLFIREDVAIVMTFVGIAIIADRENRNARLGALTIAVSLAYVIAAKLLFMNASGVFNDGEGSYGYAYYFGFMIPKGGGFPDYLITLVTNPVHVLLQALTEEKVDFILKMLVPFLLLPLAAPRWRVLLLYPVVSILFSSREYMYTIHYQYPMPALAALAALAPAAIERLETRGFWKLAPSGRPKALALVGAVLLASALACLKLGAFPTNGEFFKIYRTLDAEQAVRYAAVERMAARIPEDASVQASLSVCAYVANRRDLFVLSFRKPERPVDYLFINSKDLKNKFAHLKDEYARKEKAGTLVVIDSYGPIKLYKNMKSARWRRD